MEENKKHKNRTINIDEKYHTKLAELAAEDSSKTIKGELEKILARVFKEPWG